MDQKKMNCRMFTGKFNKLCKKRSSAPCHIFAKLQILAPARLKAWLGDASSWTLLSDANQNQENRGRAPANDDDDDDDLNGWYLGEIRPFTGGLAESKESWDGCCCNCEIAEHNQK